MSFDAYDYYNDFDHFNDFGDFGDYYGGYDYDNYNGDYYIDSVSNRLDDVWMTILLIAIVVGLVVVAAKLVLYILKGCALYTIAKRMGKEYPWLGFVPFARYYLQGDLAGDVQLKRGKIQDAGIWLIVLPIARSLIFGVLGAMFWGLLSIIAGVVFAAVNVGVGGVGGVLVMLLLFVYVLVALAYQLAYRGLRMLVDYQIYERFTTKNMAILHGGFSAVVPAYESICLFVIRNRTFNEGMGPIAQTEEVVVSEEVQESSVAEEVVISEEVQESSVPEEAVATETDTEGQDKKNTYDYE